MNPRLVRVLAIVFITLSVSPFTAPFSTCDLRHAHSADEGALGAVVCAKDAGEQLHALVASPSVAEPAFVPEWFESARLTDRPLARQIPSTVLRL